MVGLSVIGTRSPSVLISVVGANVLLLASVLGEYAFSSDAAAGVRPWHVARDFLTLNIALATALGLIVKPLLCSVSAVPVEQRVAPGKTVKLRISCLNHGRALVVRYAPGQCSISELTNRETGSKILDEHASIYVAEPFSGQKQFALAAGESRELEVKLLVDSVPRSDCSVRGVLPIQFHVTSARGIRSVERKMVNAFFTLIVKEGDTDGEAEEEQGALQA
jgi:hypothetical protein